MESNTQWITLRNWHLIQWYIKCISVKRRKNEDQKKTTRSNKYIKNKYIKKNLWEFKVKHKNRALSADRDAISFHFTTD